MTAGAGGLPIPDYVLHAVFFGAFALLLYRALINTGLTKKVSLLVAMLGTVVYGIFDDLHQRLVPGRDATVTDVVFDTIGAVIVILLIWNLLPKAPKRLRDLGRKLDVR